MWNRSIQVWRKSGAVDRRSYRDLTSTPTSSRARGWRNAPAALLLSDEGGADWEYGYLDDYRHKAQGRIDLLRRQPALRGHAHARPHPEHISFSLTDAAGADKPMGVFTGDFAFVGDVGRPDLLEKQPAQTGTAEIGAHQMYHSLERFKQLPDYLQLWPVPAAPAASALGAVPPAQLAEKLFNWALQIRR